jgi:hypothetical protein
MLTVDGLPNGWLLECTVPGISGTDAITLPDTLIDGFTIIDGDVTWALRKVATNGGLGYRQPNTTYSAGQIAYHSALPTGWYLECTTGGISYDGELAISSPSIGGTVTDGAVVWTVRKMESTEYRSRVIVDSAAAHNAIYRGKDLTEYMESGQMSRDIAAGDFSKIYIGDYVIKTVTTAATTYTNKAGNSVTQAAATYTSVKWLVAAIDPHLHCGDTETTAHHVLLIPASTLQRNIGMNPTNDTTGAYVGSDMWTKIMPIWTAAIKAAFGSDHVLSHREVLANATNTTVQSTGGGMTGKSSNWAWTTVEGANIPNETMVYGGSVFGSGYDVGDFPRMLPLYALKCNHLEDKSWFWLRAVASSSGFAFAYDGGSADHLGASTSYASGGVRPYFLYH